MVRFGFVFGALVIGFVAAGSNANAQDCASDDFKEKCMDLRKKHDKYCENENDQIEGFLTHRNMSVSDFFEQVKEYRALVPVAKKFAETFGACFETEEKRNESSCKRLGVGLPEVKTCAAAEAKYKEAWKNYVARVKEKTVDPHLSGSVGETKGEQFEEALSGLRKAVPEINEVIAVNEKLGEIKADVKALVDGIEKLKEREKEYSKTSDEDIDKARCPKGVGGNAKLEKALRKVAAADSYFTSRKIEGVEKWKIVVFRLSGKATTWTEDQSPWNHYEDIPAVACLSGTSEKGEACAYTYVMMRRKKPWRAAKFNNWYVGKLGNSGAMRCKNLKK